MLLLSLLHSSIVDFLPAKEFTVTDSLNFVNRAKTTFSNLFKFFILFHIMFLIKVIVLLLSTANAIKILVAGDHNTDFYE